MSRIMEDIQKEAVVSYKKEIIAMLLRKGDQPDKIHEKLEFPMDLIIQVQEELLAHAK